MVTFTWTGPQRVWTVSPVTVLVPVLPPVLLDASGAALALPAGAGATESVTTVGPVCGFSASSSTIPETVVALASRTRRSGRFLFSACTAGPSQLERLVVDTAVRHPDGSQRAVHLLGEAVRAADVHVVPGEAGEGRPQRVRREVGALAVRPVEGVQHP